MENLGSWAEVNSAVESFAIKYSTSTIAPPSHPPPSPPAIPRLKPTQHQKYAQ